VHAATSYMKEVAPKSFFARGIVFGSKAYNVDAACIMLVLVSLKFRFQEIPG